MYSSEFPKTANLKGRSSIPRDFLPLGGPCPAEPQGGRRNLLHSEIFNFTIHDLHSHPLSTHHPLCLHGSDPLREPFLKRFGF